MQGVKSSLFLPSVMGGPGNWFAGERPDLLHVMGAIFRF